MFNATNPASSIISNIIYRNILIALVLTGSLVTIKRWWMGMKLGARLYSKFLYVNGNLLILSPELHA